MLSFLFHVVACASAFGAGEWVESVQHGPFMIRSEVPLSTLPNLLDELKKLRSDVHNTLQLTPRDTAIEFNLFRDRRSYVEYVGARVPEGVGRRALYVKDDGIGHVYTYRNPKLDVDVRHECTHALLHNALPFLPLWLDEGIAEYFEVERSDRANPGRLATSRWSARFGWKPSLTNLEAKQNLTQMDRGDYRDAWAWVHFLLNESEETRLVLLGYLQRIQAGDPPGPLSDTLTTTIPNAKTRLVRHYRKWQFRF